VCDVCLLRHSGITYRAVICQLTMSVDISVSMNLLKGSTKAYARNGYHLNSFPSCLPGGCRQHRRGYNRSGNETAVRTIAPVGPGTVSKWVKCLDVTKV